MGVPRHRTAAGMSWLLPLVDGAPPVGWESAGAYLVMPVLLTASQFVSQAIIRCVCVCALR